MNVALGFGSAIASLWLLILIAVVTARRRGEKIAELARLVPDLARLLTRLWRDKTIPLRVRARIAIAIAYNLQPINLIPDFVPIIGLADNLVITLWAIRSTVRHSGRDAITRHWPGTPQGLATIYRIARLEPRTRQ